MLPAASASAPPAGPCTRWVGWGDGRKLLFQIMHALGFYHEHARADRDLYIEIVQKNVRKGEWGGKWSKAASGKLANFRTMKDGETERNFDYDYSSIMHYGPYFFR